MRDNLMLNKNPYTDLPDNAFWKLAVAQKSMFNIDELWNPKFNIRKSDKVVTFGSCFAQHIGKALSKRDFNWLSTEKAPSEIDQAIAKKYNYGVFSARTGNIYTTTLLKQWTEWALEIKDIPDEIWEKNGRFIDPFRPRIEPDGFANTDELRDSRYQTVKSFKNAIIEADYFVFTLGLTESWHNAKAGFEYPMCPGTIAGEYDSNVHQYSNQNFNTIYNALSDVITLMNSVNKNLKFILTVSPVPLTATKSDRHVVLATMASKSILRAVADELSTHLDHVDYFPSYEIINSPVYKGVFFEPNQRSVTQYGVDFVMDNFFACLLGKFEKHSPQNSTTKEIPSIEPPSKKDNAEDADVEVCEEALLEAFGENK